MGTTFNEWQMAFGPPDCGLGLSSMLENHSGTCDELCCMASCEANQRCTDITYAKKDGLCRLFDGCINAGPSQTPRVWRHYSLLRVVGRVSSSFWRKDDSLWP